MNSVLVATLDGGGSFSFPTARHGKASMSYGVPCHGNGKRFWCKFEFAADSVGAS